MISIPFPVCHYQETLLWAQFSSVPWIIPGFPRRELPFLCVSHQYLETHPIWDLQWPHLADTHTGYFYSPSCPPLPSLLSQPQPCSQVPTSSPTPSPFLEDSIKLWCVPAFLFSCGLSYQPHASLIQFLSIRPQHFSPGTPSGHSPSCPSL